MGIAITMDGTAGVITASSFSGSGANLTFTGADISAATGTFTGNVSVGGTLTYEDVTNIDAVGIVTARTGVKVTAGGVDVMVWLLMLVFLHLLLTYQSPIKSSILAIQIHQ